MFLKLCVFLLLVAFFVETIPGGWYAANPNDPAMIEALDFALMKYNEGNNDRFLIKLESLVSAQQQVVAGMNYRIIANVARTKCRKGTSKPLDKCQILTQEKFAKVYKCTFLVYVVPWLKTSELRQHNCV
ncbi:cystatin-2-like [Protopterus annectens]|uniref:cystatin-2-like n=1 Tax=Protopterus annectens TaxID=7888 RepID=UPI001CFBE615|nr:cystatin-2-like [Protopterus annectens]